MTRTPAGSSLIGPLRGMFLRPVRRPRPGGAGSTHRGRHAAREHGHAPTGTEGSQPYPFGLQKGWWPSELLTVPTDKGSNAGSKVGALVAGMVAGADSIDDMALLRHGGMRRIFRRVYAPSTLGSFLRAFAFGHVRQLDAVASRFLTALAGLTRLFGIPSPVPAPDGQQQGRSEYALVDVDDTIIEVHGHAKQGVGFGYTRVRGLNALLGTLTVTGGAPMIVAQRLRRARWVRPGVRNGSSPTRSPRPGGSSPRGHGCWSGWTPRSMVDPRSTPPSPVARTCRSRCGKPRR